MLERSAKIAALALIQITKGLDAKRRVAGTKPGGHELLGEGKAR